MQANTTYTIDFSDAIVDNNEGNPMGNYTYSFSTGNEIDTMEVSGVVLNAADLEPVKGMLVGLYPLDSLFNDTILKHMPFTRVSRTNGTGRFCIKGIKPGAYRAFALEDKDGNFIFSQKSERIAFMQDTFTTTCKWDVRMDTVWRDSTQYDSIRVVPYVHYYPDNLVLEAFLEAGQDQHFRSEMEANSKATISLGVGYRGLTLNFALNPAKMMGKYNDYELNLNFYRSNFGFDVIYQDAKNFTGWYNQDGVERFELPDGMLRVKTLNLNGYYAFNSRRFSYPAAFSQSYIQRRSVGSFLLAASAMSQRATLDWDEQLELKMTNIGIGGGYGYNFVPGKGWLLHLSLLPTFIVYSRASMTYEGDRVKLRYRFPEFIVTTRAAVVHQWTNCFLGLSAVVNYTTVGSKDDLSVYNTKWRVRTFFGLRI